MKKKFMIITLAAFLFVGCKNNNETLAETKKEETTEFTNKEIEFDPSTFQPTEYTFAEGTTEEKKAEYTDLINELFPLGVKWQVDIYNDVISVNDYKWNQDMLEKNKTTSDNYHQIIERLVKTNKDAGFFPDLNTSKCQIFVEKDKINGVVVYTTWVSKLNNNKKNFEVHIAPDKTVMGAGFKEEE